MKSVKHFIQAVSLITVLAVAGAGCKKDAHIPPTVTLKTGAGYTSGDATIARNTAVKVGLIGDKVEDDMISYNVSFAYDGAATTTTLQTFSLTGSELSHYDKDVTFTTRNQAGSEKYTFTITDKDGNIAQKQITITVP